MYTNSPTKFYVHKRCAERSYISSDIENESKTLYDDCDVRNNSCISIARV